MTPEAAFDMLAQFETPEQLAGFLYSEGITGHREQSTSCPIANYMNQYTGIDFEVSSQDLISVSLDDETWFTTTDAMMDFILDFDAGNFPHLIKEEVG